MSTTANNTSVEPDGPDWQAIEHDVTCPLCEYNLRGLREAKCPECGFAFSWDEVLDPHRRKHPYLFEHHGSLWSFAQTLWGGLSPGRFWRMLHPVQPSRAMRLTIYALIILFCALLPTLLNWLLTPPPLIRRGGGWWVAFSLPLPWRRAFHQEHYADFPWTLITGLAAMDIESLIPRMLGLYLLLPILMYVFLLIIFRATMRKVRIRGQHVLRCIIYGSDILIWPSIALAVMVVINATPAYARELDEAIAWTLYALLPGLWIVMAWRLSAAYRLYLRFDHPLATVISIQIILLLLYVFFIPIAGEL